jgi:hypothetical protein
MTLLISENRSDLGLALRRPTQGVESQFLENFLSAVLIKPSRVGLETAVFYEPWLESGAPDAVLAEFDPAIFHSWSEARNLLEVGDLKILQYLYQVQGSTTLDVVQRLGLSIRAVQGATERLMYAGLLRSARNHLRPIAVRRAFGIKRLIAIEAKMKGSRVVFEQAQVNRWFASETYALCPTGRSTEKLAEFSRSYGVGLYTFLPGAEPKRVVRSARSPLPTSYASWLFNEWIGRLLSRPNAQGVVV